MRFSWVRVSCSAGWSSCRKMKASTSSRKRQHRSGRAGNAGAKSPEISGEGRWRKVSVPLCHVRLFVAENLLQSEKVAALHHPMRREGVPLMPLSA